tara:strand:- start:163 stop:819 length:657 start_codon:yes stop_codon:yes gene_type:complete
MSENSSNSINPDQTTPLVESESYKGTSKNRRKISMLSKLFTLSVILICGISILFLSGKYFILKKEISNNGELILESPPNKVKGSTIKINDLECRWEKNDSVDNSNHVIPILLIKNAEFIKSSGYLQILFKNSNGKIQGDPNIIRHQNNFIKTGSNQITIRSTKGITSMLEFIDYRTISDDYYGEKWSITIKESLDGTEWTPLSSFKISGNPISSKKKI